MHLEVTDHVSLLRQQFQRAQPHASIVDLIENWSASVRTLFAAFLFVCLFVFWLLFFVCIAATLLNRYRPKFI
jgi:hypothetical protein